MVNKGLPEEYALELIINGKKTITLICTREALPELITGYLYNERIISSPDEIKYLDINKADNCARVQLIEGERKVFSQRVRFSGLAGEQMHGTDLNIVRPVTKKYTTVLIHRCSYEMSSRTVKYRQTGGVHCSALFHVETLLSIYEDIGRHNTLDKICGDCLQRSLSTADTLLVTTGRISSEMVHKAGMIGISVVASYSTPTQEAYDIALKANITLIGYLRNHPMTVYCGHERMV